jgi:hypothetical protein
MLADAYLNSRGPSDLQGIDRHHISSHPVAERRPEPPLLEMPDGKWLLAFILGLKVMPKSSSVLPVVDTRSFPAHGHLTAGLLPEAPPARFPGLSMEKLEWLDPSAARTWSR